MTVTTANGVIEQQTADSHDAEKNIFSGESRGDDNVAPTTANAAPTTASAAATTIRATTSSRARTTSRGATSATSMAG